MNIDSGNGNAGQTLPPAHGSAEHRAQLWDAINEYAEACGATPGARIYGNTKRQRAVVEIEALVYPQNADISDGENNPKA